jgi:hypothetical protein
MKAIVMMKIGEIMQLNPSQVKVYLHRARLSLRDYIVNPEKYYLNIYYYKNIL